MYVQHFAEDLRTALRTAGVDRPELFEPDEGFRRLVGHDLRATHVTLARANGVSDEVIRRRTRHTTTKMIDALNRGDLVVAGTNGDDKKVVNSTGLVGNHAYAVRSVYKNSSGTWMVSLYNPWGTDGSPTPADGKNDGYLTVTLSVFKANFDGVTIGRHS